MQAMAPCLKKLEYLRLDEVDVCGNGCGSVRQRMSTWSSEIVVFILGNGRRDEFVMTTCGMKKIIMLLLS